MLEMIAKPFALIPAPIRKVAEWAFILFIAWHVFKFVRGKLA